MAFRLPEPSKSDGDGLGSRVIQSQRFNGANAALSPSSLVPRIRRNPLDVEEDTGAQNPEYSDAPNSASERYPSVGIST